MPPVDNPILKLSNVSSGYNKKTVINSVSLEVRKGEIVLLAGSNGSGKSTLLKTIYGLLPVWGEGEIRYKQYDLKKIEIHRKLRLGLSYIPQKNNYFVNMSVKDNLEIAGITLNRNQYLERLDYILSIFDELRECFTRNAGKISGGERQILMLAMAMINQPEMLLIDEPFLGLSPENVKKMVIQLYNLNKNIGTTIVMVEHRIKECIEVIDKIIGLKMGRVFDTYQIDKSFNLNGLTALFI